MPTEKLNFQDIVKQILLRYPQENRCEFEDDRLTNFTKHRPKSEDDTLAEFIANTKIAKSSSTALGVEGDVKDKSETKHEDYYVINVKTLNSIYYLC